MLKRVIMYSCNKYSYFMGLLYIETILPVFILAIQENDSIDPDQMASKEKQQLISPCAVVEGLNRD